MALRDLWSDHEEEETEQPQNRYAYGPDNGQYVDNGFEQYDDDDEYEEEDDDDEYNESKMHVETLDPIMHHESFKSPASLHIYNKRRKVSLLRAIFADIGNNFFTYFLAIVLCFLSIYKVVQVQDTRDLIANLNEVTMQNENLNKIWLSLLAERQELSEHNKIRKEASEKLHMRAPKTDAEKVITTN